MTIYHLQLRPNVNEAINAETLALDHFERLSTAKIRRLPVSVDQYPRPLEEIFEIECQEADESRLIVEGDLRRVDYLGAAHQQGEFRVLGDAGNFVAAGMRGGSLVVNGSVGDFLAAPIGSRKSGMSGGEIRVSGTAGHYAAHRMRRGTILIQGGAGKHLAASMVAGTVMVDHCDAGLAIGMKRGSIVMHQPPNSACTESPRLSSPHSFTPNFLRLFRCPEIAAFIRPVIAANAHRIRADLTLGGQGEIIFP